MSFFFLWCGFYVSFCFVVRWSCLRRPTFQRWKVGKDRRGCGPGPLGLGGGGGDYGACKSFGCYPPFKPPPSILRPLAPRADIPLAKLGNSFVGGAGPHAAFRTAIFYLMALGLSRCGEKPVAVFFSQIAPLSRKAESKEENTRRLNSKAILKRLVPSLGGMSTAKGRATTYKFCQGDIRPRGQWPKC